MTLQLSKLKNSLRQFGLEPTEWALAIRRHSGSLAQIEVYQIGGPTFFVGWATKDAWLKLSMADF